MKEEEIERYADLVRISDPGFIEIKGVTYSGADSMVSMKNVPYHY